MAVRVGGSETPILGNQAAKNAWGLEIASVGGLGKEGGEDEGLLENRLSVAGEWYFLRLIALKDEIIASDMEPYG